MIGGELYICEGSLTHLQRPNSSLPGILVGLWIMGKFRQVRRLEGDCRVYFQVQEDIWRMPGEYLFPFMGTVQIPVFGLKVIFQYLARHWMKPASKIFSTPSDDPLVTGALSAHATDIFHTYV